MSPTLYGTLKLKQTERKEDARVTTHSDVDSNSIEEMSSVERAVQVQSSNEVVFLRIISIFTFVTRPPVTLDIYRGCMGHEYNKT